MKRFMSMLVGLLLCVSVSAMAGQAIEVTPDHVANGVFLEGMTYEGDINPIDLLNTESYTVVEAMAISSSTIVVFCKAVGDVRPIYAAVTVVGSKIVAVTYYKDGMFYQSTLSEPSDLSFELVNKSQKVLKQFQADFQRIFCQSFPLPAGA